jgi:hypothetical protein
MADRFDIRDQQEENGHSFESALVTSTSWLVKE